MSAVGCWVLGLISLGNWRIGMLARRAGEGGEEVLAVGCWVLGLISLGNWRIGMLARRAGEGRGKEVLAVGCWVLGLIRLGNSRIGMLARRAGEGRGGGVGGWRLGVGFDQLGEFEDWDACKAGGGGEGKEVSAVGCWVLGVGFDQLGKFESRGHLPVACRPVRVALARSCVPKLQ